MDAIKIIINNTSANRIIKFLKINKKEKLLKANGIADTLLTREQ